MNRLKRSIAVVKAVGDVHASCTVTTTFLIRTPPRLCLLHRPRIPTSSLLLIDCAHAMPKDLGEHSVHQVRVSTSPLTRESPATRRATPPDPQPSTNLTGLDPTPSQPTDLDMEILSPTDSRPASPMAPPSPINMDEDSQIGVLSSPIYISSTDPFDQQNNIVTSSLHSIADWLESVKWDAVFGCNPLDAATLNSNPLASAATRVVRYLNAGIAGRSVTVPELQTPPPAQPPRTTNPQQPPPPATQPPLGFDARSNTPGRMSYARAVSHSSQAPSNGYTNWTVLRSPSRQSASTNDAFIDEIIRLREVNPDLSAGELLALQCHIAASRPPRPHYASLPRGARRAVHVVFSGPKPDPAPLPAVVVQAVNARLPAKRSASHAASANWLSCNNVTIRFAQAPEELEITAVRSVLGTLFPHIPPSSYSVGKRQIISTVKFHRLPLTHPDGSPITVEQYTAELKASPAWQSVHIPRPPCLVQEKDSHVGTLYVDFYDNSLLSTLHQVLCDPALFQGEAVHPVKYHKQYSTPQCTACLQWGHPTLLCRSPTHRCAHCTGLYSVQDHRQRAECCHGDNPTPDSLLCPHSPSCVNCGAPHNATNRSCPFYQNRHNTAWIEQHQPNPLDQCQSRDRHDVPSSRYDTARPQGPSRSRRVHFLPVPSTSPAEPQSPQHVNARGLYAPPRQAIAGPSRPH
ncbi:hypothetical protein HETIRDRAFT_419235 [Heterobasidion irregulare TC 32-1]|uniref:Uncharacterized protein n=1 Tax=Heterobasidion irregulare (strain TC 32-1) TaxID=747525 RepID=W4K146_HETIT|nr:uncharacterized protein HETIRDRAFT_419235 [Heterobasidion irregulare TC 32-1]ETW79537.1 hypothetical protein HETIRDRAFT_419235 [Heterobasidion irregulare TC 32-1]